MNCSERHCISSEVSFCTRTRKDVYVNTHPWTIRLGVMHYYFQEGKR